MLVRLIGKNFMCKLVLPRTPEGNYWISDKSGKTERKLVNIEGKEGKWQITSDEFVKIINPKAVYIGEDITKVCERKDKIIDKIVLREDALYGICFENSNDMFLLYCSPVYDNTFKRLDIKDTTREISIGKSTENTIEYTNPFVANKHARIYLEKEKWMIENFDNKYGTFVNDEAIIDPRYLKSGDIIYIVGLKIIVIGDCLYVNNLMRNVIFDLKYLELNNIENRVNQEKINGKNNSQENDDIYSEDEFFSRAPRITNMIETEKMKIDPPPARQSKQDVPFILLFGSTLSMAAMAMVSIFMTISGIVNKTATIQDSILSILMSVIMLASSVCLPILNFKYENKRKAEYEERRQKRYKDYIESKIEKIDEIMNKQRQLLFENNLPIETCQNIILKKLPRLWERKIENFDFLQVKLGIGDIPLKIDIQYPEEQFMMEDDNLVEILHTITNKSKILEMAPISISFAEKNILAIIYNNKEKVEKYIQNIILQLITFQSYQDLKLVFLLDEDKKGKWDYLKMLPYVWSNANEIRFFSDDYDEMEEISRYLEEEFSTRNNFVKDNNADINYKVFSPYYLIITDNYKKIEKLKVINNILKSKINLGFSLLCITNDLVQLPNECRTFISIENEKGVIFDGDDSLGSQKQFIPDDHQVDSFDKIVRKLANIPIRNDFVNSNNLSDVCTFLEMYDVGRIEQLNILERWEKNNSIISLQAPVGVDTSGRKIILDIHEKFHGPHGLIAGSTGSGKSEFIITYILSLAVNYSPEDVAFVLIDYKGGGLAGAFQKGNVKLPHIVGTITNIDTVGLQRSLASIQSELRRRQIKFNQAREKTAEGTIDIYKYQKLYHEGIVDEPIPHLLIICDEFAELKQQQEDFMEELMSVSRIGRSLGVHLILATQKPAGIVNDQIRSNSRFAVCLKVQDKEDSMDVIKRPDAARLKHIGQFYLQVGNDEYFVFGQAAWAGAQYFPSNIARKNENNSITFISNIGTVKKEVEDSEQKTLESHGEQLINIVKYIYELAIQKGIRTEKLWLDSIPEDIYTNQIKKKYNYKPVQNKIEPVFGEYDDPLNQYQGILTLSTDSNIIVYGNADSGKETFLSTITYEMMTTYSTDDVQIYIFDFGSEALKIFKPSPHVGDVVSINEKEKIERFFNWLKKEIKYRKNILSNYNGNYNYYINNNPNPMPKIIIMLNNYEAFSDNYESEYEDIFMTLTREGTKCGIIFIITTSSFVDIRYRLSQNFKQKIALQLNNEDDYLSIFDNVGKKRPSHIFGRGLINKNGEIYEFQTAKICDAKKYNKKIEDTISMLNKTGQIDAKSIPVIPRKVRFKDVEKALKSISNIPLGIAQKSLNIYSYDFTKNLINIIIAKNIEDVIQFTSNVLEELKKVEHLNVVVFDAERIIQSGKNKLKENYEDFYKNLNNIEENNISENTICVIIGIDRFLSDLDDGETEFYEMLNKATEYGNYNFIISENATKFKNHEYDEWYKKYVINDDGIWIGKGINDQYVINVNTSDGGIVNNCNSSFGYIVKDETPTFIKLLEMNERDEDNE